MTTLNRKAFLKKTALTSLGIITLPQMIHAATDQPEQPLFINANAGKNFRLPHIHVTVKISEKNTRGRFALFEETTAPGFGVPLHAHEQQWETFEILEGRYKIKANDEIFIAEKGSIVMIPPNTPHAYINIHSELSRFRFNLSPALNFEGFIAEMSAYQELPATEHLVLILKKYGMNVVGPPLDAQ